MRVDTKKKSKAHYEVSKAIKQGILPPAKKFMCRGMGINGCIYGADHYHHWSYSPRKWLSVIPVCSMCHGRITRGTLVIMAPWILAVTVTHK